MKKDGVVLALLANFDEVLDINALPRDLIEEVTRVILERLLVLIPEEVDVGPMMVDMVCSRDKTVEVAKLDLVVIKLVVTMVMEKLLALPLDELRTRMRVEK